jgi:hypothetical protein
MTKFGRPKTTPKSYQISTKAIEKNIKKWSKILEKEKSCVREGAQKEIWEHKIKETSIES